jgi:hypothetical protein
MPAPLSCCSASFVNSDTGAYLPACNLILVTIYSDILREFLHHVNESKSKQLIILQDLPQSRLSS